MQPNLSPIHFPQFWHHLFTGISLLKLDNNFNIRGFIAIRLDISQPEDKGVCTLIKENLNFLTINFPSLSHPSVEFVVIKLLSPKDPIIIINIYRHSKHFLVFLLRSYKSISKI